MRRRSSVALALCASLLAACSGGSGAITPRTVVAASPTAAPTTAPVSLPSSAPRVPAKTTTNVVVTIGSAVDTALASIRKPLGSRSALFVSPNTLGIDVAATPTGGGAAMDLLQADVSSGSSLCTGGSPRTCTLPLVILPGSYTFSMTLYAATPAQGFGAALGTTSFVQTISIDAANSVLFTIGGIVAGTALGTNYFSMPADGVQRNVGIVFVGSDASGAAITGSTPYASPIAVSIAETAAPGTSALVVNGTLAFPSASLTKPTDSLSLTYSGNGPPGYSALVTVGSANLRMSPMQFYSGSSTPAGAGASTTVTVKETLSSAGVAYTGHINGCAGIATASGTGTGNYGNLTITDNIQPYGGTTCSATITDTLGTSLTFPVTIPAASLTCSDQPTGTQLNASVAAGGYRCGIVVTPSSGLSLNTGASTSLAVGEGDMSSSNLTVGSSSCVSGGYVTSISPYQFTGAGQFVATGGTSTIVAGTTTGSCSIQVSDGVQTVNVPVTITASGPTYLVAANTTTNGPDSQTCNNANDGNFGDLYCGSGTTLNSPTFTTTSASQHVTVTVTTNAPVTSGQELQTATWIVSGPNGYLSSTQQFTGTAVGLTLGSAGQYVIQERASCSDNYTVTQPSASGCQAYALSLTSTVTTP